MDKSKTRIALFGLVIALAFGGGALLAWLGSGGGLSYTEPRGNPSAPAPAGDVTAKPAAQREAAGGFAFADGSGKALTFADLAGRVALVNLWATWCQPCVAEMPALDGLQGKLGGDGFQVVAVSLDRGGADQVKRWFDKRGIKHLGVFTASAAQFPNALLPSSLLLDKQGRVAWQGVGIRDWEGEEAQAVIRALMAE